MKEFHTMRRILPVALAAVAAVTAASSLPAQANIRITGAGATFPYPIYSKWVLEYTAVRPNIQINYASIGSGGGIRQFSDHTVDFGATDGPMTDSAIAALGGNVLHIPTVLGAVVPIYNVPGVTQQLRFTPDVLAGIYLGQITNWNDSRIAAANPGVTLPDRDLVVVHRSDGSGTSYIFTDYLSKVSADWLRRVGRGTAVNWPVGLGGQGNPGVAATVSRTPGAVGYVELIYARQTRTPFGLVRNRAGNFVQASLASTTAAAAAAMQSIADDTDFRISITDAAGADAYPIASFTWLLIPKQMANPATARHLVDFVWWATHDAQRYAQALDYAALPSRAVAIVEARLRSVTLNGSPVLPANFGRGARR
jgi:phosphate transport system substrate-binding protein